MKLSLRFMLFVIVSALSGFVLMGSICWSCGAFAQTRPLSSLVAILGFRGFIIGLLYGVYYVYEQRWVLQFPIIQRPLFFSFKVGVPLAIRQALKLSAATYLISSVVLFFFHNGYKNNLTAWNFIAQQIIFYNGNLLVFLCWELIHHLHQVLHTKRFSFAPPKGSAAAETNPSESLLTALEESTAHSLLQYLAYLDLCMVCERNVDTWRRAAFFEETGETYKRVVTLSLRPLELLTVKLGEGLESSSIGRTFQLSDQLRSPTDLLINKKLLELNYNFQLCAWCAQIVASVTASSHSEDRFGVAQLSGSHAAVISTLLSALLVVETLMGKKTNLQHPYSGASPAGIRWAPIAGMRDSSVGFNGRRRNNNPFYVKAYAMADILRTSIYLIVSTFHSEMQGSAKTGHLEKDWIGSAKVLYGTHELLSQKLQLFLEFKAC